MDAKKYLLASLAVFVAYSALAYVAHEVLLDPDYRGLGEAVRGAEGFHQRLPLIYVANLIFAAVFCLVYAKGYERDKGWIGQGLRFGLLIATLLAPVAIAAYVAFPVPGTLALKWIGLGYLQMVITAWVAAGIYRPE